MKNKHIAAACMILMIVIALIEWRPPQLPVTPLGVVLAAARKAAEGK